MDNKIINQVIEDMQKWWAPRPQRFPGPYSVDEFRAKIREDADGVEPPEMDPPVFHFHHDMRPENVIVSIPSESFPGVHVAGIIDWEQAGFYPKLYIMLDIYKPLGGYLVSLPDDQENPDPDVTYDYNDRLANAIEDVGGLPKGAMLETWYFELKRGWDRANARRREEHRARVAARTT